MTPLALWTQNVRNIPEGGLTAERTATPDERAAIARALDIVAVKEFSARYTIASLAKGRYKFDAVYTASIVQSCVVSLEEIDQHIREHVSEEFHPASDGAMQDLEQKTGHEDDELEALSHVQAERIVEEEIQFGRILFEDFATAIDPYPRKEGASFDWADKNLVSDSDQVHPFAKLAKLKQHGKQ